MRSGPARGTPGLRLAAEASAGVNREQEGIRLG
jgi:hypothetical protein